MPKNRNRKEAEVADLSAKLQRSKAVVIASEKGVTVKEMQQLRADLREQDSELVAIKKTLLNKVFSGQSMPVDLSQAQGTVLVALAYSEEVSAAKVVSAFLKKHEGMSLVGGILENQVITQEKVQALALLPSKQELLAHVVRTIQAPISGFVNVCAGSLKNLVGVLNAIKESKG